MDTINLSIVLNNIVNQALGKEALAAYNAGGIVSLGDTVLSSQANTDAFMNTLTQRLGKTIISTRAYRNKLADMNLSDFRFGAIMQKVKIDMPEAVEDPTWNMPEDGQSVDHYIIARPKAHNKLFVTRAPYSFFVTFQLETLREAFLSEEAMSAFIGAIYTEIQNKIEVSLENLGRLCITNYMAELSDKPNRVVNLLTDYNKLNNTNITAEEAMEDEKFLRYAVTTMRYYTKRLTDMSTMYNDGSTTRHTPVEDQRLRINSLLQSKMEGVVEWMAFNKEYVQLMGYSELNFWQSAESPMNINIERASDGKAVTLSNIVGILSDRDAMGTYKKETYTLTTPINARAGYYNTFWHEKQLWFNDLSENAIIFTLN